MPSFYTVRMLPSRKLLMIANIDGMQRVLGCQQAAIARLDYGLPCTFYHTKPHGTVEIDCLAEEWQVLGEDAESAAPGTTNGEQR